MKKKKQKPSAWITEGDLECPEIPFFFFLKQNNKGKIDSHFWLFHGICPYLNPDLIQLFDIGTIAKQFSLTKLFLYMESHPFCGGCAGEIETFNPTEKELGKKMNCWDKFEAFILTSAQYVEYK